ncbi:MAG: nucleoside-diphosphate kinase [Acidimicrobiaceae bacterium]|jgi:nucleoside-diphosphate kinase|nr:nucleoside-diphosphate kinase [Acidimicrobiaceae bacterium]|tara:strand:+ start:1729 stop:2136 length:408 start_codon:yes stop_codon:yes gene_type:complete
MDKTLVICKPDAVERGLVGEIISRFERKGLHLVAVELRHLDEEVLSVHYEEHLEKPFYGDLVSFMSRSPVVVMVVEGPEDTYAVVRSMMGATNPRESAPGTIRGDYGLIVTENLVHGSDSPESAEREIGIFFPNI